MNTSINTKIFDDFPVIQSERLLFRAFELTDAKVLFQIRSDDRVMEYMDTNYHQIEQDALKMIEYILLSFQQKQGINWAIIEKESNKMIGYIGFWRFIAEHVRGEIGYALSPDFWNKGYMFEAAKTILSFGFKQIQFHSIEANVNQFNSRSIHLLEKLGFIKEAHFKENYFHNGKFIDSIIYSLIEPL